MSEKTPVSASSANAVQFSAAEVMRYLEESPQFFEQYAGRLSSILIPHPYGGRAISLTERQLIALRDKNRELESRLTELTSYGEANDILSEKMQRLSVALLGGKSLSALTSLVTRHLKEDFSVPYVSLSWRFADGAPLEGFLPLEEELLARAENLEQPYCGGGDGADVARLFGAGAVAGLLPEIRSLALIRLAVAEGRNRKAGLGLLGLGSDAPDRFYAGMGTVYLRRLGEMVSAALAAALADA
ncbi:MAG: DUF484 family protein [Zoogloeaceae bacterium]|jgi:uncharacterized protein YigA (DUF484 family)|nr:DUF484 family protein [Zoogloeaceae bacterium]